MPRSVRWIPHATPPVGSPRQTKKGRQGRQRGGCPFGWLWCLLLGLAGVFFSGAKVCKVLAFFYQDGNRVRSMGCLLLSCPCEKEVSIFQACSRLPVFVKRISRGSPSPAIPIHSAFTHPIDDKHIYIIPLPLLFTVFSTPIPLNLKLLILSVNRGSYPFRLQDTGKSFGLHNTSTNTPTVSPLDTATFD